MKVESPQEVIFTKVIFLGLVIFRYFPIEL